MDFLIGFADSLKDANLPAASAALVVLLFHGNNKRRAAKRAEGGKEFDERQQLVQLKGSKTALNVMLVSYFLSWFAKSLGFAWFGSSLAEMLFPLVCTSAFLCAYSAWNDVDYPLATKESAKKKWNIFSAAFALLLFACAALIAAFAPAALHAAVILLMLGCVIVASPLACAARKSHDKKRGILAASEGESVGE